LKLSSREPSPFSVVFPSKNSEPPRSATYYGRLSWAQTESTLPRQNTTVCSESVIIEWSRLLVFRNRWPLSYLTVNSVTPSTESSGCGFVAHISPPFESNGRLREAPVCRHGPFKSMLFDPNDKSWQFAPGFDLIPLLCRLRHNKPSRCQIAVLSRLMGQSRSRERLGMDIDYLNPERWSAHSVSRHVCSPGW